MHPGQQHPLRPVNPAQCWHWLARSQLLCGGRGVPAGSLPWACLLQPLLGAPWGTPCTGPGGCPVPVCAPHPAPCLQRGLLALGSAVTLPWESAQGWRVDKPPAKAKPPGPWAGCLLGESRQLSRGDRLETQTLGQGLLSRLPSPTPVQPCKRLRRSSLRSPAGVCQLRQPGTRCSALLHIEQPPRGRTHAPANHRSGWCRPHRPRLYPRPKTQPCFEPRRSHTPPRRDPPCATALGIRC